MSAFTERGEWYNSRRFIVLSTLAILWTIAFLVMFRVRMQSGNQEKPIHEEQIFTPEDRPFFSLDGSVSEPSSTASVMIAWNPVPGTSGYELSYVTLPFAPQTINTMTTVLTVAGLTLGSTYDFKVRAFTGNGTIPGPYSSEIHYTTEAATPTPSPTATSTATATPTATFTPTATIPPMVTPSPTPTATSTATATSTPTATATIPPTPTPTPTPSPSFSISISPPSLTALPQGGYLTWSVNITKTNGYSAPIILSHDLTLPGVASRFSPDPLPTSGSDGAANFVIFVGFIPSGAYPITVTGESFEPVPIRRTATTILVKP